MPALVLRCRDRKWCLKVADSHDPGHALPMVRNLRGLLFVFFFAVSLAGCAKKSPTEIVLSVDTTLAVPGQLDELLVTVTGPDGVMHAPKDILLTGAGAVSLPATLGVTSKTAGNATFFIVGKLGGGDRIGQTVHTMFVLNKELLLQVTLDPSCYGMAMCPEQTNNNLPIFTGQTPTRGSMDGGTDASTESDSGSLSDMNVVVTDLGTSTDGAIMETRDAWVFPTSCSSSLDCTTPPGDPCGVGTCVNFSCSYVDRFCMPIDACHTSACQPGGLCSQDAISCDDANPCTVDGCDPGTGCTHTAAASGTSCGRGTACDSYVCAGTLCVGESIACGAGCHCMLPTGMCVADSPGASCLR